MSGGKAYLRRNEHGMPGDSTDRNATTHHFLLRVGHSAAMKLRMATFSTLSKALADKSSHYPN